MITEILTAIIDEAARRARPLDQYRIPPPMRSTLGDLPTLETIIKRRDPRWDRVSVNRLAMQPATEIAARCRRCRAVSIEAIPDHMLERADSLSAEIQVAIARLGCYCVARPSEITHAADIMDAASALAGGGLINEDPVHGAAHAENTSYAWRLRRG